MSRMLFVNLPVADVAAARTFWTGLGMRVNEDFSNDDAVALSISDLAGVMLLRTDFFHSFHGTTTPPSGDQVLLALSADTRAEVDDLCERALAAGGSPAGAPQEHPGMYGRSFRDPDGHVWEVMAMGDGV